MTEREIAEAALAARRAARRTGHEFRLDEDKLHGFGISNDGVRRIRNVVVSIEKHIDAELATLKG